MAAPEQPREPRFTYSSLKGREHYHGCTEEPKDPLKA